MGINDWFDRWASRATGPTEAHIPAPIPARGLTASGVRINLRRPNIEHARREAWQVEAWEYREKIPEMRFAGDFVANTLGRLRVFPAENRPRGEEPVPLEAGTRRQQRSNGAGVDQETIEAACALVERLNINQHGSSLLGRYGENVEFAGECFLHGEDDGDGGEAWSIRSVSEMQLTAGGATKLNPYTGSPAEPLDPVTNDVYRLWTPHPRYSNQADSSVRSLLNVLRLMDLIGQRSRAHHESRISAGKALYIPSELSMQRPGSAPVSADIDGAFDDEGSDPFMEALTTYMTLPVTDNAAPEAIVPMIIRGPAFFGEQPAKDVIGTIELHSQDPKGLIEEYEALVQQFARGVNLSPERIKGMGESNNWQANVITADEIKTAVEPRAERMCDSLTAAYMYHGMRALGISAEQRRKVCLWFDPAELTQNPNRTEDAKALHAAGELSGQALRDAAGFTEADAPTTVERALRALSQERLANTSVPALLKLLSGQLPTVSDLTALEQAAAPRPVIDATPNRLGKPPPAKPGPQDGTPPVGQRQQPATQPQPGQAVAASAAKGKGPKDDPGGPSVAGVALMAADTGRVLMLQRGLDDDTDPAAGTWEFPGGHVEDGDPTSFDAGRREWAEEVGRPFPDGGHLLHTWTSPDGLYQGHVVVVATEDGVDLDGPRTVTNADADYSEQAAWWDPDDARRNPALRKECRKTPWNALKKAARTMKSPAVVAALAAASGKAEGGRQWRVDKKLGRRLAKVDADFTARVLAAADASIGRALERAANRARGAAQKHKTLAARYPKGSDPRAILAAAGRSVVPADVTDDALLADAFDELEATFRREAEAAADAVEDILETALGKLPTAVTAAARSGVAATIRANITSAWGWLHGRLRRHALEVLFGGHQPSRGGEQSPGLTPVSLIRGAGMLLGGLDSRHPGLADDGTPLATVDGKPNPGTGPGTGDVALDRLRVAGGLTLGREWAYHYAGQAGFKPHKRLDGTVFESWTDPQLAAGPDADWIPGRFYHPQDHSGCMCGWAPIAVLAMVPDADPDGDEVRALRAELVAS